MVIGLLIVVGCMLLTACGTDSLNQEMENEYIGGLKIVNLFEESTYEKNGDKMVKAVEHAVNATPNDFHMLNQEYKYITDFFSYKTKFEETFKESECDFYYVGDMKDNKPHGYGVITNGYDTSNMIIYYIGEFKNGEVEGCYGMALDSEYLISVEYEGTMSYLFDEDLSAVPADP